MQQESTQQKNLEKLNTIIKKLQKSPLNPDSLLKQYITIYTTYHHQSQEYFATLCQHKFIYLLILNSNKVIGTTSVLQCLNYLITNSKKYGELAYILSQNDLHNYLFNSHILQKQIDFIQYYIQLIKTILLKISQPQQNRIFIRIFCNEKYPNFPILNYITILARDQNQLIKVTAQQCILILIKMINQNHIFSAYLSQPSMLAFITHLANQFLLTGTDREGICKYFADLLYQLRNHIIPLLLISNICCNVIIIPSLPYNTSIALSFVSQFQKCIQTLLYEHSTQIKQINQQSYYRRHSQKLNNTIIDKQQQQNLILICSSFYQVLIKYMTDIKINNIYFSSIASLTPSTIKSQPSINIPNKNTNSPVQNQYKILSYYNLKHYINENQYKNQTDKQYNLIQNIQQKIISFCVSKQFGISQQNCYKESDKSISKGNKYGIIVDRLNQYVKYIANCAGVAFVKGEPISHNLVKLLIPTQSAFISQYISMKTKLQPTIPNKQNPSHQPSLQLHPNYIQSTWNFSIVNLQIIYIMIKKYKQSIHQQQTKTSSHVTVPPSHIFLIKFKIYLELFVHQHIQQKNKNTELVQSITMIITLWKICRLLDVHVSDTSCQNLMKYLQTIHPILQNYLYPNGFIQLVQYLKTKNQITLLDDKNKPKKYKKNDKTYNLNNNKNNAIKIKNKPSQTILKLCCFQFIQKLIFPQIKTLKQHFSQRWIKPNQQIFQQQPPIPQQQQSILLTQNISYKNNQNCKLQFIKHLTPPTILLKIHYNNQCLLQTDLLTLQKFINLPINSPIIQFGDHYQDNFIMDNCQSAQSILHQYQLCKDLFLQCLTSSTLQYIQATNQRLNKKSPTPLKPYQSPDILQ